METIDDRTPCKAENGLMIQPARVPGSFLSSRVRFFILMVGIAMFILAFSACVSTPQSGKRRSISKNLWFQTVRNGDVGEIYRLLDEGIDIDAQDSEGATALMIALACEQPDIARLLLEKHASIDVRDNIGHTVLMYASQYGYLDIVELLLQQGADVNDPDDNGATALFYASLYENLDIVKLLLQQGADVKKTDKIGVTALFYAAHSGYLEIAEVLLDKGAEANAGNMNSETPLMPASTNGYLEVVNLLLSKGADPFARSKTGSTAIYLATMHRHTEVVHLLNDTCKAGEQTAFGDKEREVLNQEILDREGITYIATTDSVNNRARDYVLDLFCNPLGGARLPSSVLCGPMLWQELVQHLGFEKDIGSPWMIYGPVKLGYLEGRVIVPDDQTKKLQYTLKTIFQENGECLVRKPTTKKLAIYWQCIPWFIEEPVFVI